MPRGGGPAFRLEGIRLLVVDDDPNIRGALAVLFGRVGAIVMTAAGAAQARASLADALPDAIVCDIAMANEDGYSFLRSLRLANQPAHDVPVIAFSAGERAQRADLQFDAFVEKSAEFDELAAVVAEAIERSRPRS
jgi:CheY-like chemotaxis protein